MTRTLSPVCCNLIIGRLGSGKTSLIQHLLNSRPDNQKWAVIVNEFGQLGIDAALIEGHQQQPSPILQIAGGCLCCTTRTQLQASLTRLIREQRPDRLLIEASGLGHPAGIIDLLRSDYLADIIELNATLAVIDASLFVRQDALTATDSPVNTDIFRHQAELADIVILNKQDLATPDAISAAYNYFQQLFPAKQTIIKTSHAHVSPDLLTRKIGTTKFLTPVNEESYSSEISDYEFDSVIIQLSLASDKDYHSIGLCFDANVIFNRQLLLQFFSDFITTQGWQNDLSFKRLKAVLNTGKSWHSFNIVDDGNQNAITGNESYYRTDNRIEIILENNAKMPHREIAELFVKNLLSCRQQYKNRS